MERVTGYKNYDSSEFDRVKPLLDDDDALESLWKKEYSLSTLVAEDQFKSYDDLNKRLKYVLGQKSAPPTVREQEEQYSSFEQSTPTREENVMQELEKSYQRSKSELPSEMKNELNTLSSGSDFNSPDITPSNSSEEDDALSYFQRLAEE